MAGIQSLEKYGHRRCCSGAIFHFSETPWFYFANCICSRHRQLSNFPTHVTCSIFRCGLVVRIVRFVQVPLRPWQHRSLPHSNPRKTVGSNFSSYSICGALTWIFLLISRLVLALHYHLTR